MNFAAIERFCSHQEIRLTVISSIVNVQSRSQLQKQIKIQFKLVTKNIQVVKLKCKFVLKRFSWKNDFQ